MSKSCVLHIGLPKTATTSFQNAVYKNRAKLLSDCRILYPAIEANHTNALCAMFLDDPRKHITLKVRGITELAEAEKIREDYRATIERELEGADWDVLVMSAEGLSNLPAASLSALREWGSKYVDNWRVLFWSRHPVRYAASVAQQLIKNGRHMEEMIQNPNIVVPNYRGRAANAFGAFGREAVELTAFEDAVQEQGGVVAAFCRRIGLEEAMALDIAANADVENESMSLLATYVLDSINRQRPFFVDGKINPQRRNGEVPIISKIGGQKFDVPAEFKSSIRSFTRPDVKWLNDTFKTQHYLDIFDDNTDFPTESYEEAFKKGIDSVALLISDLINVIKR